MNNQPIRIIAIFMSDDETYQFTDGTPLEGNFDFDDISLEDVEKKDYVPKKVKKSYIVVSRQTLFEEMEIDIISAMETLETNDYETKRLLHCYGWNTELLLADYFDKGKEFLFSKAGIGMTTVETSTDDTFDCPICFDDVSISETSKVDGCGHRACKNCWSSYLSVKVEDSLQKTIPCIHPKCPIILSDQFVKQFLSGKDSRKFDDGLLEDYVANNKKVLWCPSKPFCGNAIKVIGDVSTHQMPINCRCGHLFCFTCQADAHQPCTCEMLEKWKTKLVEEGKNMEWIGLHTKKCPKCSKPIEKNGGCNHMNCASCHHDFCWICLSSNYHDHKCSMYDTKTKSEVKKESEFAVDVNRYMHYLKRYKAHTDSLQFERKLRSILIHKIQEGDDWLLFARDVLFQCRRTVINASIYSYFSFDYQTLNLQLLAKEKEMNGKQQQRLRDDRDKKVRSLEIYRDLFENHLHDLEKSTEALSKMLESLEHDELVKNKQKIVNLVDRCQKMADGLYDVIKHQDMHDYDFE